MSTILEVYGKTRGLTDGEASALRESLTTAYLSYVTTTCEALIANMFEAGMSLENVNVIMGSLHEFLQHATPHLEIPTFHIARTPPLLLKGGARKSRSAIALRLGYIVSILSVIVVLCGLLYLPKNRFDHADAECGAYPLTNIPGKYNDVTGENEPGVQRIERSRPKVQLTDERMQEWTTLFRHSTDYASVKDLYDSASCSMVRNVRSSLSGAWSGNLKDILYIGKVAVEPVSHFLIQSWQASTSAGAAAGDKFARLLGFDEGAGLQAAGTYIAPAVGIASGYAIVAKGLLKFWTAVFSLCFNDDRGMPDTDGLVELQAANAQLNADIPGFALVGVPKHVFVPIKTLKHRPRVRWEEDFERDVLDASDKATGDMFKELIEKGPPPMTWADLKGSIRHPGPVRRFWQELEKVPRDYVWPW